MKFKNIIIAVFSCILILFGILGISAGAAAIPSIKKFKEFIKNFPEINESVKNGFESMSIALKDASDASAGAGESVVIIKSILGNVSDFSEQTSKTFYDIAGFMNFEILGQKPFEDSYIHFMKVGDTLLELSDNVSGTTDSILRNIDDVQRLGRDLEDISNKIDDISEKIYSAGDLMSFESVSKIFYFLIIYIVLLNLMFVLIGFSLLMLRKQ